MKFIFWNLNKKNLIKPLADMCSENKIDIILLCEYDEEVNDSDLYLKNYTKVDLILKRRGLAMFINEKFTGQWNIMTPKGYFIPIHINSSNNLEFILYLLHLPSDMQSSGKEKREKALEILSYSIKNDEDEYNIFNQIIVGDFNLNPFDKSLISINGLNAINSDEFIKGYRTFDFEKFKEYYNPMWKHYGDKTFSGTYYYGDNYDGVNLYSYIYDQAIFSKELIPALVDKHVKIIYNINGNSLLIDGKPNKEKYSDHLPISFEIKED